MQHIKTKSAALGGWWLSVVCEAADFKEMLELQEKAIDKNTSQGSSKNVCKHLIGALQKLSTLEKAGEHHDHGACMQVIKNEIIPMYQAAAKALQTSKDNHTDRENFKSAMVTALNYQVT